MQTTSFLRSTSLLILFLAACQGPDQGRSQTQDEKNAKVQHAIDRVSASADQVINQGIKSAEEMKREITNLSLRAQANVLAATGVSEEVKRTLDTHVDGLRAGVLNGKEALLAKANAAAKALERTTRPSSGKTSDDEKDAELVERKASRF